jgi:hypothetical protein
VGRGRVSKPKGALELIQHNPFKNFRKIKRLLRAHTASKRERKWRGGVFFLVVLVFELRASRCNSSLVLLPREHFT